MRLHVLAIALSLTLSGLPALAETASDRLAAPGPEHAWMDPLAGRWDVEMRVWPGPGAEPFEIAGMTAERELVLGGRYLREVLVGGDGTPVREATMGYNRLDGRFELVTVDSFEPGQMVYLGRGDQTAGSVSMHGESTEAGMGPEPTGRKRDLRFDFVIEDADTNVQRIHVRYPGGQEYLFVEQRFTRSE
jgi:hypothetical protein